MADTLTLLIDHRDTTLSMDGKALHVSRAGVISQRVPLGPLGLVVIHGNAQIGCDVWRALSEAGIPAVMHPSRGDGEPAYLGAGLNAVAHLRARQHRVAADPQAGVGIAKRLVERKLLTYRALAAELASERDLDARDLQMHIDQRLQGLANCMTVDAVMGHEGAAAAAWTAWLASWLPSTWQFRGRNRRPPRDPVNALLSLTYTILNAEMLAAIQNAGLDPSCGFLHAMAPARAALALDLIETLRAGADHFVLNLLDGILSPTDFTQSELDGCRLGKPGRQRYYEALAIRRDRWWMDKATATLDAQVLGQPDEGWISDNSLDPAETMTFNKHVNPTDRPTLPQACAQQVRLLRRWLDHHGAA